MSVERAVLLVVGSLIIVTVRIGVYRQPEVALDHGPSRRPSDPGLVHRHVPGGPGAQATGLPQRAGFA